MSSAQQANDALNLVAEKIDRLVKRSEKLKASDPAAKTLAHEIAVTLASQLSFAEIWDKSGAIGKLKALPDWGSISDNDPWIHTHPLFPKSVGYQHPQPLMPPAVLADLPTPLPPTPSTPTPIKHTHAPSPVPPVTVVPKAKLFVPGNSNYNGHDNHTCKCRAVTPEPDVDDSKAVEPAPKKARTHSKKWEESRAPRAKSRARSTKPKSKEFISDDECDEGRYQEGPDSGTQDSIKAACQYSGRVLQGEDIAEPEAATPTPNVDNDINMDFDAQKATPYLPGDAPANPAVQQPSNLDIIQMIQAMRQEFAGMLQNSGDRSEALNLTINTRVNDLAHNWEERFAAMEKKMREVKLHTAGNMVSIGHMANAMKAFTTSGDVSAFQPTPGPSTQGHLFGQIPSSWIPQLPPLADDSHPLDPSASEVGKLFTTAWDESRGPGASVAGESSASIVESSGHPTGLSAGSQLSSLPSGSSSPKD
ncbi:hypothetical protein F4604DRAFT_1932035 [Suillus subluteus]|nr:hypothetical protein F4604DRAFT_1932035 [Suillus subluteus]